MSNCKCDIIIGQDILGNLKSTIENNKCFFVIDKFIYEKFYDIYFKEILCNVSLEDIYLFECNEKNKDIDNALLIIKKLNFRNHLRNSVLIGIGGGIIGDIVGFVSSVYMRGIKFINVPTTFLAQIDSSIGGKNALNIKECKNLIGTFYHPKEIIIDTKFLNTISKRELVSGLAEAIKYGIVFEYEFLDYIKNNLDNILNLDVDVMKKVVLKSCKFKTNIVEQDEYDFSLRKILNYGHTIGHALESVTNYSLYTHGEAVFVGMFYETCIAYEIGIINEEYFNYIMDILKKFRVSIDVSLFSSDLFYEALLRDKKNKSEKISFILPTGCSKVLEYMFSLDEVKKINYSRHCF